MTTRRVSLDPAWAEALAAAARHLGRAREPRVLFLEEREDLSISRDVEGRSHIARTALRGVALRGREAPSDLAHLSDPDPESALVLARGGVSAVRPCRDEAPAALQGGASLEPRRVLEGLESAAGEAERLHAGAMLALRYVGFRQRIAVLASGDGPVLDVRQGDRLRVEARLRGKSREAAAVVEAPLKPGSLPDPGRLGRLALERARRRLAARPAPAGTRPAVFAPGVGGIVIHELVGHALEGDVASRSALGRSSGPIAPAELRILDDPRRGRAPWRIDDEGETPRPTALLDRGGVVGRLHDRGTARRARVAPTGHARCASYRDPVLPRMGCTFVAPGRLDPREVLQGIDLGVYVRRIEGAVADPVLGRATFRVTDADTIEKGRIGRPCDPFLLRISIIETLSRMDRIADDLTFDTCIGSCVRDGQAVAVSVGAPTICLGVTTVLA